MFIVLEGVDGTGKTTLSRRLAAYIETYWKRDVVLVREPGGTPEAEEIRSLIVDRPANYFDPVANALLFGACRAQVTNQVIRPALSRGAVVISDRYKASSIAYQHFGGRADLDMVIAMNELSSGGLNPDMTFILTSDQLEEVLGRNGKKDARDLESFEFYSRVVEGYHAIYENPRAYALGGEFIELDALDTLRSSMNNMITALIVRGLTQ